MTDSYFVIFNSQGVQRFAKSEKFELKSGEHAVKMTIEVPDEAFAKPQIPVTRVVIPTELLSRTIEVAPEVGQ